MADGNAIPTLMTSACEGEKAPEFAREVTGISPSFVSFYSPPWDALAVGMCCGWIAFHEALCSVLNTVASTLAGPTQPWQ